MDDIRVPVRVRKSEPELRYETSRFVVDLRTVKKGKGIVADIRRKGPHGWEAAVEVEPKPARPTPAALKTSSKAKVKAKGKAKKVTAPPTRVQKNRREWQFAFNWGTRRITTSFMVSVLAVALIIPGVALLGQANTLKSSLVAEGVSAVRNLASAGQLLGGALTPNNGANSVLNADEAKVHFDSAYTNFINAQKQVDSLGNLTLSLISAVPGLANKLNTGNSLLALGQHVSIMGREFSNSLLALNGLTFEQLFTDAVPLTDRLHQVEQHLVSAHDAAMEATTDLENIDPNTLPNTIAPTVASLRAKVPTFRAAANDALSFFRFLIAILGDNNPRKYLFLFQNNAEIRPTGGFIGSFAELDVFKGRVTKFFVNDVYNIDGQIKKNVIPPRPLQKITGAWSFHDANWFFDFPTSAQKLEDFYELDGGPTIDGIITFNPTVLQQILSVTGPVNVPEDNITFTADNVVDKLQYQVERGFDKQTNQPKTVVADLAKHLMDRLQTLEATGWSKLAKVMLDSFARKDILAWFREPNEETFVTTQGWGGEIRPAPKDYLAVVNTNLNGYKTDKVVSQTIDHEAHVQNDGSIIDTVTVTRTHLGGNEPYDWYNRVNSDYLRVYVPKGSTLISETGATKETYHAPLDYAHLPFVTDPDVVAQESTLHTDAKTGTDIFTETGRTVFGNWVYISPGHTVTVTYKYKLPFRLEASRADTYSLLVQKQPGEQPGRFRSKLTLPNSWQSTWHTPDTLRELLHGWSFDRVLNQDTLYGVAVTK